MKGMAWLQSLVKKRPWTPTPSQLAVAKWQKELESQIRALDAELEVTIAPERKEPKGHAA